VFVGLSDSTSGGGGLTAAMMTGLGRWTLRGSWPLREHIRHTPVQVLAGGVLGVIIGATYAFALGDQ
jgi:acid phosphatase family membrane protein YuiD